MRSLRFLFTLTLFFILGSTLAYSDSIPVFQTGVGAFGVTSVSGAYGLSFELRFLAGAIQVQGTAATCDFCVSDALQGTVLPLTLTITTGIGAAQINGVSYSDLLFHGSLQMFGDPASIRLQGILSNTFHILDLGGQWSACPALPNGSGCASGDIATFQIGAGGVGHITFLGPSDGRYTFSSASFDNFTPFVTPEPQTLLLLGTGVLAVVGRFLHTRRRH